MPKMDVVTKVWIEEGCIVCDACETTAPDVFDVTDDTCLIRPEALNAEFTKPRTQSIIDAAEECPVDVIKFDTVSEEVDELPESAKPAAAAEADPATKAPAAAKAPAPAAPAEPAPAASKSPVRGAAAAMAVDADPTIQALLKAATARGGAAEMQRKSAAVPEEIQEWKRKLASELPPDIRHARALEAESRTASKKAEAKSSDKGDEKSADPNRREAIGGVALAGGWLAFGGAAAIMCGPAFGRFMMPNVLEEPDPKVRVGTLERYAEMAVNDVNEDFKPKGIWLIRQPGEVAALNIICTHLGCIPNWLQNDGKFKCPCHGSGFKPSGINFEGPAPRPLERFRIYEENGQIIVDKSKKFQYERGEWSNPDSFLVV